MSAKKAKLLRRVALGLAVQAEEAGRRIEQRGTAQLQSTVVNRRDTYRGIVRELKKGMK